MAGNNPMEQFAIRVLHPISPVAGVDLSFTNSSLWMLIALAVVAVFLYAGTARPTLVPGRMQAAVETIYGFIVSMMDENVGPHGRRFVPLIFSRSEEHTSELQSLMRISYAVFCLQQK